MSVIRIPEFASLKRSSQVQIFYEIGSEVGHRTHSKLVIDLQSAQVGCKDLLLNLTFAAVQK